MNINRSERDGMLLVLASVTGYSMLPVFIKALQVAGLSSLDIATWRFALAVPLFWLMVRALRMPKGDRPLPRGKLLVMGILLATAAVLTFWGFERMPAGTFVVLFYTYPAMVAVLSALLGERLPPAGWGALLLTTIGIILTVPDFGQGIGSDSFVGVVLALISAFIVAVYFILSGRLLKGHTALGAASAWTTTGALLTLLVLIPFRALQMPGSFSDHLGEIIFSMPLLAANHPNGTELWLKLLAIATVSTVLGSFFLTIGIQKVGAARASIVGTVEPILTLIFTRVFLGEEMLPVQLIGGSLIVASLILIQIGSRIKVPALE
jgi:drug/metabolite transporter (DMT)-like permease